MEGAIDLHVTDPGAVLCAHKAVAEIVGLKLNEIAPFAGTLRTLGLGAYILDMSPKAPVFNVLSAKDNQLTSEQLVVAWAAQRTARNWVRRGICRASSAKGMPNCRGLNG